VRDGCLRADISVVGNPARRPEEGEHR
jgi:hypothetical protein